MQDGMFSYVTLEQRVPQDHPLREVRRITDVVLGSLNDEFDSLYSASGRPSIAPEYVLRALLLQAFYSVRSERQLVEQLDSNLLFRWFVGLGMDDAVWNHAVFSKNRERLLTSDVAQQFFAAVVAQARRFMSDDHFTVDGTLIGAWASQKSFRKKDGSGDDGTNFHGGKRSNDTHESTTDPAARLYRKRDGTDSRLAYLGHTLVENRNGLIARAMVTQADGYAEREAALLMLADQQKDRSRRITVGGDKGLRLGGLRARRAGSQCDPARRQERRRTPLQHGPENDQARRLRDQPELPVADREELRLAQANGSGAPGQGARAAQGGLGLRLHLRRAQPAPAAKADRAATRVGSTPDRVRKCAGGPQTTLRKVLGSTKQSNADAFEHQNKVPASSNHHNNATVRSSSTSS